MSSWSREDDAATRPGTVGADPEFRATYEEFDVGGERVAMIADPRDDHAWVQSDTTVPVDR